MKKALVLNLFFVLLYSSFAQNISIVPPVKIPMVLSGSFAELRSNHFHSGIDIKTQGVTGLPVYSVADGYVSRISVSPSGFGNALYITHFNGTTSVYGHLESFRNDIQEYVKNIQYEKESFQVDIQVPENQFPVKQGEEVAQSGNTGSSGGPHLHFEIRDTKTEEPLNPLNYQLPVADNQPPRMFNLLVIPQNRDAHVSFQSNKKSFPLVFSNGKYRLSEISSVPVYGEIGFAVEANDFFNESANKCGIYSMEMEIDGELYFSVQFHKFSFDETRFINSFIDYQQFIRYNRRYQKAFVDPGNKMSVYQQVKQRGIYNFNDEKKHQVKFMLKDAYGNLSELEFTVESKPARLNPTQPAYSKIFRYNESNEFKAENIELKIKPGNLYDDVFFQYKTIPGNNRLYSDIHKIHNNSTPIHKNAELKINSVALPQFLQSKALLVNVDTLTGKFYATGGEYSDGWIKGNISNFGNYAVAVDTVPPVIAPLSIKDKNSLTESNRIRFRISDNLAGIDKIEGFIDGKWALFEYDQKNATITHRFDASRFEMKKRHQFVLNVTDYKGNTATYEASFWK